jgi:hypothetical protein
MKMNRRGVNEKGQVMPFYLAALLVLLLCWAMVINIAKLLRDRMMLQNAADNAALSVAVLRARTLNLIGITNYLMASALSSGAYPCLVPVSLFNIDYVGGSPTSFPFPFCDVRCNNSGAEYHTDYAGVNRLRYTVNSIAGFQKLLIAAYPVAALRTANRIGKRQEINKEGEETGADAVLVIPSQYLDLSSEGSLSFSSGSPFFQGLAPEKLLGIRRNRRRITYYKTVNIGVQGTTHHHFTAPSKWFSEDAAWYTADSGFHQQKIIVIATKSGDAKSQKGYPLFKGIFNLRWPSIVTIAAAATYNTGGTMFPVKDDVYTGVPACLLPEVMTSQAKQLIELRAAAADCQLIPVVGQVLGCTVAFAATATELLAGIALVKAESDGDTPIRKYEDAQYAGWDAHLVPVGGKVIKH